MDPDVEDEYLPNKDLPIHYDPDGDPDLTKLEQEVFEEMESEEDETVDMMNALGSEFAKMTPLQKGLNTWVVEREEFRPGHINPEEWKTLDALGDILEGHSSTPTLPWVLPMYELTLKHLRKCEADTKLPGSLRLAATAGLEKLNTKSARVPV
ncbi:hypothetical protein FB451DRAFT_1172106 [Mycena latifolia]|nr:hypothetical protein FB451DRAFT_1172106 [Mycena latifolia]